MPRELRIHVDVDSAGRYEFRMRSGRSEVTTRVNPDLAASFFEDLRLLRWKLIGIHDPGDILLSDVGDRLAALVAAPAIWERLRLPDGARQVRVQFSQAAHRLMQFPWELLRVNNRFLIGDRGGNLTRELPSPVPQRKKRNPIINIAHVSFGTDSNLRLDEERCMLLETIPAEIPIEFFFYSSARRLEVEIDAFRPHIVIVSGHGHYDELQGEHYLSLRDDGYIRTAEIVALCASYGCELLVLSTCESARLGGPVVDDGTVLPADVVAFSFPVMTTTAIQSIECLLRGVIQGQTVDEAMAAVRAIDSDDEYAFFNAVHLHRSRARSLHISNAAPRQLGAPATRCPGMEFTLDWLNGYAHWEEPATLLAAAGSGGETLIRHWAELVQRSQTQATRWRVLVDEVPILDSPGAQLVRLAYPYSFAPVPTEHFVYGDGMDQRFAKTLLAATDQNLARQVAGHPLLGMLGFVTDLIAGRTEHEATERFEQENRMAERAGRLNREGSLFASWLFANKGIAATTFENRAEFAERIKAVVDMTPAVIVAGIENAVAATVVLPQPDVLYLAHEFMLLGERWFPNWRTDHRAGFRRLCGAFFMLAAHSNLDVETGSRLLDWAVRQEDWTTAIMILVAVSRWYGEHGRLEDLEPTIDLLLPHATGMERVILRGHLVTIATNRGDYRTGLAENQQLEADLQGLVEDSDYYRNLHSAITQQIDCLVELDQLDEAERRWRDADALIPHLEEHRAEAQARLLGQLANLRSEQNQVDVAIDAASQAVQHAVANHCPDVLVAELRNMRAEVLRLAGRDREALEELNVVSRIDMPPGLRSRFLHLKALLLKDYGAPQALEYLLESSQSDRLRGDDGGVAISLLAIARIFTEEHEYDRARERIREALPLADACGLVKVVGGLALLWAKIDLAEGKTSSAASWLATARDKFAQDDDEDGIADATRLLDTLRAPVE
jgi:tetratricopeptide (TPR) repeat protein